MEALPKPDIEQWLETIEPSDDWREYSRLKQELYGMTTTSAEYERWHGELITKLAI
jgi:Uma2 family endonuclease